MNAREAVAPQNRTEVFSMDFLKKFWPHAFAVKKKDTKDLVVRVLVYALAGWALPGIIGFLLNLLTLGLLGTIVGAICWVVGAYCTVGIVLTLLKYFKVI